MPWIDSTPIFRSLMQDRHIAEPGQPFRMFPEHFQVEMVQRAYRTVAPFVENHCPDGGIIECPLQITGTLPVGSGKPTAVPAEKVFAQFDRQSPRSDRTDKRRIDLFRQFGRHGYDGHRITGPQERRAQVGVMLRLSGHIGAGMRRSLEKKQKQAGKQQPSGISAAIHIVWL